jgi:hypothetical protein
VADYSTIYVLAAAFVVFRIYNMLGGWPEAYYRIRRYPYFVDYIKGPDKRFRKHVFLTKLIHHSPAQFPFGKGNYLVPDEEASASGSGAPLWFHNWDDARPIPTSLDTITDPETGQVTTKYRDRLSPVSIRKGFENQVAADIHRNTEPNPQRGMSTLMLVLIIAGIVLMVGVLYYEYSNGCAVHAATCQGSVP